MAIKRKSKRGAFEAIHSSASALHRVDAITDKAMWEFDESCRTTPDINSTPSNRTPGRVKGIDDDAFFEPLPEAELGHLGVPKDGEASAKSNDVSKSEPKSNSRNGSSFDDFLKDEGIFEEVHAKALQRALTEQGTLAQHEARAERGDAKVGLKVLDNLDRYFSNRTDR